MFPIEYIRTDRNGTKYFADWTCPRCGGAGQAEKWVTTGKLCYGCGGTGRRPKPLIVKKYTPEHEAKLEARRKAREAKRLAENPPPSEDVLRKRAEEARRNVWQSEGFTREGVGFLHTGETYKNKDKLYAAGGHWSASMKGYVVPRVVEGLKRIKTIEIHAAGRRSGS